MSASYALGNFESVTSNSKIQTYNPASIFFTKIEDLKALAAQRVNDSNLCYNPKNNGEMKESINEMLDMYMKRIDFQPHVKEAIKETVVKEIVHLCSLDKKDGGGLRLGNLASKVTDEMKGRWAPKGGLRKTRKTKRKKSKKNTRRC